MKVLVAQSCPTLCNIVNWNLPGSSIHGILQARILVWVAIPFSRGSSQPRDPIWSPALQADSLILYHLSHQGSPKTKNGSTSKIFLSSFSSRNTTLYLPSYSSYFACRRSFLISRCSINTHWLECIPLWRAIHSTSVRLAKKFIWVFCTSVWEILYYLVLVFGWVHMCTWARGRRSGGEQKWVW